MKPVAEHIVMNRIEKLLLRLPSAQAVSRVVAYMSARADEGAYAAEAPQPSPEVGSAG